MKDYYKILEVKPNASQAEIKKAYRLLAVQYHPDKNNGSKVSEERFKEISESYIILGDTAKRNAYDYTKGHYKNYNNGQDVGSGRQTPVTFLILFKRIKERVLNANGRIKQDALYKVIDDLLSHETITFLITVRDIATNNLIIDEVLTCCIFLKEPYKTGLYTKLTKLADGDPRFTDKLTLLHKENKTAHKITAADVTEDSLSRNYIIIFVLFLVFFAALLVVANL